MVVHSLHRIGELWKATFTDSPIGIAIASKMGKFVMCNPSFCHLLGYAEQELIKYRWQDITHPDDLLQEASLLFAVATGERHSYKIRKRYIKKDSNPVLVVSVVSAVANPDGHIQYLINQCLDLTEINRLKNKPQLTPELASDIAIALSNNEFYLQYEPIQCLNSNKIVGEEGLIRWRHPSKGLIAPLDWIPACEEDSILMSQVCSFVVRQGLLATHNRQSWVSVNVSPISLNNASFVELLDEIGKVGDKPRLFLEITERMPLDFSEIQRLQLLGYGIMLDDFGQGHSSVIQLLELINVLDPSFLKIKIDGWFSHSIAAKNTGLIMREFISLLHRFNLDVIAECIETETGQLMIVKQAA